MSGGTTFAVSEIHMLADNTLPPMMRVKACPCVGTAACPHSKLHSDLIDRVGASTTARAWFRLECTIFEGKRACPAAGEQFCRKSARKYGENLEQPYPKFQRAGRVFVPSLINGIRSQFDQRKLSYGIAFVIES